MRNAGMTIHFLFSTTSRKRTRYLMVLDLQFWGAKRARRYDPRETSAARSLLGVQMRRSIAKRLRLCRGLPS